MGFKRGPQVKIAGKIDIPGLKDTAKDLTGMSTALKGVTTELKNLVAQKASVVSAMKAITSASKEMSAATGTSAGGRSIGGGSAVTASGSNYASVNGGAAGAVAKTVTESIGNRIDTAAQSGEGQGSSTAAFTTGILSLMATPMKYAYDRIEENRGLTGSMARMLGPASTLGGVKIIDTLTALRDKTPVYGNLDNILGAINTGSMAGYDAFGGGARAGAFYANIRQQQAFMPGAGAAQLAQMNAQTLGNTGMQQRAMMYTGGAFSSFGPGGVPKTLQEWAESILRFFESQRPGNDRGKKFTKEELQTNFFPGSNMNAWFDTVGVSEDMRSFFWQYAIGKANVTGGSGGSASIEDIVGKRGADLASARLQTTTASARRDFGMASAGTVGALGSGGSMYEDYVGREAADRVFSNVMGAVDKMIGSMLGSMLGGVVKNIPTPIADMLATFTTDTLPVMAGQIVGAASGFFTGDPGWGSYGGTGMAGLQPAFADKLGAMMAANPNLTITSGYRDGGTQQRLYDQGVGHMAPPGQSFHSKGLAADLGPPDQFGWIVANAAAFGLESGAAFGEPWHVGAPGTQPIGDVNTARAGVRSGDDLISRLGYGAKPPPKPPVDQRFQPPAETQPQKVLRPGVDAGAQGPVAPGSPGYGTAPQTKARAAGAASPTDAGASSSGGDSGGGILGALGGALGGLGGMIPGLGGLLSLLGSLKEIFGFAGGMFPGFMGLMTGDFSKLFGEGGPISGLTGLAGKGLSKLLGLPDFFGGGDMSKMSAKQIAGQFGGFFGSQNGAIKPQRRSSMDPAAMGTAAGALGSEGGSAASGGMGGAYGSPAGTVPADQSGRILQTLQALKGAGFQGDTLINLAAIAGRESGWDPTRTNMAGDDNSYGLFQINMKPSPNFDPVRQRKNFGISRNEELLDPNVAARAAMFMSKQTAQMGKGPLWPWKTSRSGDGNPLGGGAAQHIPTVQAVARQNGFIGDPLARSRAASMLGGEHVGGGHTVNAYITVGGGGMAEADARRVGSVIADTLESEMKQRLARTY